MPEGQRGPSDVSGDLGPGRTYRGVDQASQATQACARGHAGWTHCPGQLGALPHGLWVRRNISGDSGPGPSACGVDQLSWAPRARARGFRCRPAVMGVSCPVLRAHGFYQMSRATRARVRVPAASTSSPARLGSLSEGLRGGSTLPDVSGLCPMAHGVDQLSWVTPAQIQGPLGRPNIPGHTGPGPSPRGVDQLSREPRARVRAHARCTSCPGHLWTLPEASQFCPYVPGDSGPVPRAHGQDQLFG